MGKKAADQPPPPPPLGTVHHVDGDGDGTLKIHITRGRRLAAMDRWTSASDPYVNVYYGETLVGKTGVVKHTTNPVWRDGLVHCATHGPPCRKPHKKVTLELFDEDAGTRDDALGRVVVDVGHLGGALERRLAIPKKWYDVEAPSQLGSRRDWGQVELSVDYEDGGDVGGGGGFLDGDVRSLRLLGTLFDECDADRTGRLDRDEFRRLYAKLKDYEAAHAHGGEAVGGGDPAHALHLSMKAVDADGDGAVSFEELRKAAEAVARNALPSGVDVVVRGARNLANVAEPRGAGCTSASPASSSPFAVVSVDGRHLGQSKPQLDSCDPTWDFKVALSRPKDVFRGDHGMRGEVASVELFHYRKKRSPAPLGRVDVDVASEYLLAKGLDGAPRTSRRWHRVAAAAGCGDARGEVDVEVVFLPPAVEKSDAGTAGGAEDQGDESFDDDWAFCRGPAKLRFERGDGAGAADAPFPALGAAFPWLADCAVSAHWADTFVCGDRARRDRVLELETKLHGVVELQFADDVELYAWWKHLSKVHDRTLLLDAPADPKAQKFLPEHARPTVVGPRGGAAGGDDDFASTMARRDGATWVVAQKAAKRVLERLTRPPRVVVEPDALGPRVFAYRAFGGAGPQGDVAPYYRTDARVPTRRGAAVAVATWAPVEKAAHRPTIVYCSGTNSSGRADAISSGALAVALELRAALVAFDFVGSGGSDDGVTSFGWWERYDVAAVARLRDHVLEVLKDALKPDAPYREQLVQEIAGFVDERLKRRADFRLDDVDPAKECANRLFKDKPVLVIGEHDAQGSVAASHAQELNGVLRGAAAGKGRRRSVDDGKVTTNHEILVVQGRTGPQRAAAAHVPAALAVIAGFLEKVFPRANPVAFAFFTRRAPHGIRDRLLARTPPWVTDDPELAKMSSHLQNVERAHAAKKAGGADAARKAGDGADAAPAAKPRHKKHHKPDDDGKKKHAKAAADDGKKKHHHHHHQKETQ
ncbi:hypothetical protein JL722_3135 [Aureococcus anophagefferens]|nr:hypothetical protein JL722_3135 [Aureococcus anophagefferens]